MLRINPKTNRSYNFKDLTGKKFKELTVMSFKKITKKRNKKGELVYRTWWVVKCSCGKIITLDSVSLHHQKSCGDRKHWANPIELRELKGKRFGKLVVLEYLGLKVLGINKKRLSVCKVECDCGTIKEIPLNQLIQGTISCGCEGIKIGSKHSSWKGEEMVNGRFFGNIVSRARRQGYEIDISISDIVEQYKKQNYKCVLTGLPIDFGNQTVAAKDRIVTVSVDRIDSSKGYLKDNIQLVHKDLNTMKFDYPQEYFIEMCKLVANNNK